MNKIVFILSALFLSIASFSQDVIGTRVIARQSLFVKDNWVDSLRRDSINWANDFRTLPTTGAVYNFVVGRIGSGTPGLGTVTNVGTGYGLSGGPITGTGTIVFDSTTVFPQIRATISSGGVSSVSGTTNRITSTGGATPVIDISASYVGQSSITTLGTITTGIWTGTDIAFTNIAQVGANTVLTNATTGSADISTTALSASNLLGRGSTGNVAAITVGGILSFSGTLLSATEVDGSISNELQTVASTSDATSHTVTLSNSGGSIQLVEGSNITLTTTGTGLNGIVTIASTGGAGLVDGDYGDITVGGSGTTMTIDNGVVTFAKMQAITDNRLLGAQGGTAVEEIALTANDFDLALNALSIDYTNGQAASGSAKGFLTSTDWTTFNDKVSFTNELAQDAIGAMVNASLQYVDGTPLLAIGDRDYGSVTVSASGLTWTIDAGAVSNTMLANSTISGIALGSNLADLTAGYGLLLNSGTTYNGGTAKTASVDTSAVATQFDILYKQNYLIFAESVVKRNDSIFIIDEDINPRAERTAIAEINGVAGWNPIAVINEVLPDEGHLIKYDSLNNQWINFKADTLIGFQYWRVGVTGAYPDGGATQIVDSNYMNKNIDVYYDHVLLHPGLDYTFNSPGGSIDFNFPLQDSVPVVVRTYSFLVSSILGRRAGVAPLTWDDFDFDDNTGSITESPANTWSANAGAGYGQLGLNSLYKLGTGTEGAVRMQFTSATSTYGGILGLDVTDVKQGIASMSAAVAVIRSGAIGDIYRVVPGGTSTIDTGFDLADGDWVALWRYADGTIVIRKSVDGTNWTDVHSYGVISTADLFLVCDIYYVGPTPDMNIISPQVRNKVNQ